MEQCESEKQEFNFTYMLKCGDGSLYTGWTNDMVKRLEAHRSGAGAKYTHGRGPLALAYLEVWPTKQEAMSREAQIKRLSRAQKLLLIRGSDWLRDLPETVRETLREEFSGDV